MRRNLMMTTYYIHPNGEIATEASGRQDKAAVGTMEGYYYPYRFMALKDQNGIFSAICKEIETTVLEKSVSQLSYFLEDTSLWRELPKPNSLPTSYAKTFPYSGLVRIRRGNWDSTVISQNPTFLTFHSGNAVLQGIRFSASFFGKGQFQGGEIRQEGKDYVMDRNLLGPIINLTLKTPSTQEAIGKKCPEVIENKVKYSTSPRRLGFGKATTE
ncbi:hypothetical protein V8V91_10020 [Algoriphagus halophilus]|uniref:hypothetical protein n=1 Tax=Algoriphagus halophilus TaxID=226505 RepID=UPI00358EAC66